MDYLNYQVTFTMTIVVSIIVITPYSLHYFFLFYKCNTSNYFEILNIHSLKYISGRAISTAWIKE